MRFGCATPHRPPNPGGRTATPAVPVPSTFARRLREDVAHAREHVLLTALLGEHDVVVAAGAVVTRRLLAHGVYAGVPAKRIRDLAGADPATDRRATA
ncbi:hypothetical protein EDF42_2786 [Curtobacterium sp. PhB172]|uniref:hypothetical protein n=1 Tax=Curtobacterium sp. PhB172 TaxID=2485196 RepID=UPI000F9DFF0A|nr:hypothetical protein [Curtobacterium sp. PhB172]ROS63085.1 hypothetical protein EDF42_2786 [Curtobacterium sp. PhB172]